MDEIQYSFDKIGVINTGVIKMLIAWMVYTISIIYNFILNSYIIFGYQKLNVYLFWSPYKYKLKITVFLKNM